MFGFHAPYMMPMHSPLPPLALRVVKARCTGILHHQTAKHADTNASTEGNDESYIITIHISTVVHRTKFIKNINYHGNAH